jgi:hypothetical protein
MFKLAAAFGASFVLIFLRALQQRNISASRFAWLIPVSVAYTFAEAFVIIAVVSSGFHVPLLLSIGVGAGCGAIAAILFCKRVFHE